MTAPKLSLIACPNCDALNEAGKPYCSLCDAWLGKSGPMSSAPSGRRPRFRLSSLMLIIAVIAVPLAIAHESPWVAAVLGVPAAIALIWTIIDGTARGRSFWDMGNARTFLATFLAVHVIVATSAAAFAITWAAASRAAFATWGTTLGMWVGAGVGLIPAGIVGVVTARWLLSPASSSRIGKSGVSTSRWSQDR